MDVYIYPGFSGLVDWDWVKQVYKEPRNLDAGLDLVSPVDAEISASVTTINLGVCISLPRNHFGLICDRSSMAAKGFKVSGGVIDPGYLGTISVNMFSVDGRTLTIKRGQKIAQLLVIPFAQIDLVFDDPNRPPTPRGERGYGSTGEFATEGY